MQCHGDVCRPEYRPCIPTSMPEIVYAVQTPRWIPLPPPTSPPYTTEYTHELINSKTPFHCTSAPSNPTALAHDASPRPPPPPHPRVNRHSKLRHLRHRNLLQRPLWPGLPLPRQQIPHARQRPGRLRRRVQDARLAHAGQLQEGLWRAVCGQDMYGERGEFWSCFGFGWGECVGGDCNCARTGCASTCGREYE
jgi:hypothetical protein